MPTLADLEALLTACEECRRLDREATPGPWSRGTMGKIVALAHEPGIVCRAEDADFICAARKGWPAACRAALRWAIDASDHVGDLRDRSVSPGWKAAVARARRLLDEWPEEGDHAAGCGSKSRGRVYCRGRAMAEAATQHRPRTEAELVFRVLRDDGGWLTDEQVASQVCKELGQLDDATRRRLVLPRRYSVERAAKLLDQLVACGCAVKSGPCSWRLARQGVGAG